MRGLTEDEEQRILSSQEGVSVSITEELLHDVGEVIAARLGCPIPRCQCERFTHARIASSTCPNCGHDLMVGA